MPIKSQEERIAAERTIREQLGLPMLGTDPLASATEETLQVEREILGVQAYAFGEVWSRPALTIQERCFITLAVLASKGLSDQLADYVGASLNVGISPSDILEGLLQIGSYAGLAATTEGMNVARRVFVERGINKPGASKDITPVFPMSREDRGAAQKRVALSVGMGRLGLGANAQPLAMLKVGPWSIRAKDLAFEKEELNVFQGEYGYGELWGRPALGYRVRSMMTVASLQTLVENDQLHFHLNNALNIGFTPEEVHEILVHAGVYAGVSGWRNAANVFRDILLQRGVVEPV